MILPFKFFWCRKNHVLSTSFLFLPFDMKVSHDYVPISYYICICISVHNAFMVVWTRENQKTFLPLAIRAAFFFFSMIVIKCWLIAEEGLVLIWYQHKQSGSYCGNYSSQPNEWCIVMLSCLLCSTCVRYVLFICEL